MFCFDVVARITSLFAHEYKRRWCHEYGHPNKTRVFCFQVVARITAWTGLKLFLDQRSQNFGLADWVQERCLAATCKSECSLLSCQAQTQLCLEWMPQNQMVIFTQNTWQESYHLVNKGRKKTEESSWYVVSASFDV